MHISTNAAVKKIFESFPSFQSESFFVQTPMPLTSLDLYLYTSGILSWRTVQCTILDTTILRFSGIYHNSYAEVLPGAQSSNISINIRVQATGKPHHVGVVAGIQDYDNMVSSRIGRVKCVDITSDTPRHEVLTPVTIEIEVANIKFPAYTHVSIHRAADMSLVPPVQEAELTTVGNQNITVFQNNFKWKDGVFWENIEEIKLAFYANKSDVTLTQKSLAGVTARSVSANGRAATFTLPSFKEICSARLQCPARVWVSLTDTKTGGTFRSQVFYTEKCHDTHAWPDPTTESSTCLSFTPDVAARCAYGFGGTCQDCPHNARCPGGERAWPMPGHWSQNETSLNVVRCVAPALERCPKGFDTEALKCTCGVGYNGIACGGCAAGYFQDRDLRCAKCPENFDFYKGVVIPTALLILSIFLTIMGITLLTLIAIFTSTCLIHRGVCSVVFQGNILLNWFKTTLYESFLFGLGLLPILQVIATVMRPIPTRVPKWYKDAVAILDIVMLDASGIVHTECIDGDMFSSERRVLIGSLICVFIVLTLKYKPFRPENICFHTWCCWQRGCIKETSKLIRYRHALRFHVTPNIRKVGYYVLSLCYGLTSSIALTSITCINIDGVLRIRLRPDLRCYNYDDGTLGISILSWTALAFFVVSCGLQTPLTRAENPESRGG